MRYPSLKARPLGRWPAAVMALFLLAASCGWAMPEKRKHTRPPYVGPRKTVEGIWRPFQPTVSNNAKPAARPSGLYGHIVVR